MAGLNMLLALNTERYAKIKTIIQCKSETVHSTEVHDWSAAPRAQREQESNAEQRQPEKPMSWLKVQEHQKNWTQKPATQSQVAKVSADLEWLWGV